MHPCGLHKLSKRILCFLEASFAFRLEGNLLTAFARMFMLLCGTMERGCLVDQLT